MKIFVLILALYVVYHCIGSINRMDENTSNGVYAYHLIFAISSFSLMLMVLEGHHATIIELMFLIGMATRYMFNRRNNHYELRKP